jgi:glyoxylase-like metal-dependent hydrolase (beta-lactamase superfamily II)
MTHPKDVFPINLNEVTKAVLLKCENKLVLVDTGLNVEHADMILQFASETLNMPLEKFGELCVITHSHSDHIGGLAKLAETCRFNVAAHTDEVAAIETKTGVTVDRPLKDGDILPYCGGIQLIHVAGHTHGNACLYLKDKSVLIVGDTLNTLENDQLKPPKDDYNVDSDLARQELRKLTKLDFDYIVICHGKDVETEGKQKLKALLASFNS